MDIKDFVKESLRQLVDGVREVQSEVVEKSQIAPIGCQREKVEFDIAVTVEEEKTKDKKAGLSVYCIKAGADAQTSASTSTVHRIKFGVHVDFESKAEKEHRRKKDSEAAVSLRGSGWEVSIRTPAMVRWPGHIPAGVVTDEIVATYDWMPTLAALIGESARVPTDRPIDGLDMSLFMLGKKTVRAEITSFTWAPMVN